jgi:hypothetical protein
MIIIELFAINLVDKTDDELKQDFSDGSSDSLPKNAKKFGEQEF